MAIFKFYQIFRSIKEILGEEIAMQLFPEYSTLPDKMPASDQAALGKKIMDRLDKSLDKETVIKIRQKHTCNPSKIQISQINEVKERTNNLDEFCKEYSSIMASGYIKKKGNFLTVSFGLDKCVCGMFRKLESYETVSKTWCECCNGHVMKMYSMICDKPVESEIIDTIVCGGHDCVFYIKI